MSVIVSEDVPFDLGELSSYTVLTIVAFTLNPSFGTRICADLICGKLR